MDISYSNLDEKREFFNYERIDRFEELAGRISEISSKGHYCFRGQERAEWKLSSSAQRSWTGLRCSKCWQKRFDKQLRSSRDPLVDVRMDNAYLQYLYDMFKYAKRNLNSVIPCAVPTLMDCEVWGFLQHYSFPTPLVDFSEDWGVALFMAIRNARRNDYKEFERFSIYAFCADSFPSNECLYLEDVCDQNEEDGEARFTTWVNIDALVIKKPGAKWCPVVAEERMASQGGLFVYNKSSEKALEEVFAGMDRLKTGRQDEAERVLEKMICFDVSYGCLEQAQAKCFRSGLNNLSLGLLDDSIDNAMKACYKKFLEDYRGKCSC